MIVIINGQKKTLSDALNINQVLNSEGYKGMLVAVAQNGTFVPKGNYDQTKINDGDEIEIVAPMQGG